MTVDRSTGIMKRVKDKLSSIGFQLNNTEFVYFVSLYKQLFRKEGEKADALIIDANDFRPSALLSAAERSKMLGAFEYSDLEKRRDQLLKIARETSIIYNPMNGGLGTSVKRERYLKQNWNSIGRKGPFKLSAKGSDLFVDITLNGKTEKVSISEIKLLRIITESNYYKASILKERGSDESIDSINDLLDFVNVYARAGDLTTRFKNQTYRQIFADEGRLTLEEPYNQQLQPVIDQNNTLLPRKSPGGHGFCGVYTLLDILNRPQKKGNMISVLYNSDGINNWVDPLIAGLMVEERIPIAMLTTTKTSLDKKGGQIGVAKNPDGTWRVEILEVANAKSNEQEQLFLDMGLTRGEAGAQYFNTNTVIANYTILQPFLGGLVDTIGMDEFIGVIGPSLIKNAKKAGGEEYFQLEGALGSVILNLNSYLQTTSDPRIKKLMSDHNITSLVRIINVDQDSRARFFTPVKNAIDYWLLTQSDLFTLNTKTWELDTNKSGHLPAFELTDSFYNDVQNCIDAFTGASVKDLDYLEIKGVATIKNAILKGTVRIVNESGAPVDFSNQKFQEFLGIRRENGRPVFENVSIVIDGDGRISSRPVLPNMPRTVHAVEDSLLREGYQLSSRALLYFTAMLRQLKSANKTAALIIGKNFTPSALLDPKNFAEEFGGITYEEIAKDEANSQSARSVILLHNEMNGGIGSSLKRKTYLRRLWKGLYGQSQRATEKMFTSAKGSDLFWEDIELNGQKVRALVSVSEARLLAALQERDDYAGTIIQTLASDESRDSIYGLLDTVNIYGRMGIESPYGTKTYARILEDVQDVVGQDPVIDQYQPGADEKGDIVVAETTPGHGICGMGFLLDSQEEERQLGNLGKHFSKGDTVISVIANGDGLNNGADKHIIGWMRRERVPIVMVTTKKTQLDKKGGQLGIEMLQDGSVKLAILETADAISNGQLDLFKEIGLRPGDNEQDFNTNTVLANYSILAPFLKDLRAAVGEDEFLKIISPTLIKRGKKQDVGGVMRDYIHMEGALGSVVLNFNAYISTTNNTKAIAAMKKHNITKLVRVVRVPRRFFTPVKFAIDFWMQAFSDLFKLNTKTWRLTATREGHIPAFVLDSHYDDLQNCIDAFGHASTRDLDTLEIKGIVEIKDAVLKGTVRIINQTGKPVDLNVIRGVIGSSQEGPLVLENTRIVLNINATTVTTIRPLAAQDKPQKFGTSGWRGDRAHFNEDNVLRAAEGSAQYVEGIVEDPEK